MQVQIKNVQIIYLNFQDYYSFDKLELPFENSDFDFETIKKFLKEDEDFKDKNKDQNRRSIIIY